MKDVTSGHGSFETFEAFEPITFEAFEQVL